MLEAAGTRNGNGKTILVVEDSTRQASHLQALLEQEGLKVELAYDGRAGLQMAQQLQPDLITLGIQMPEMNGFQVCLQLKEAPETADIPVIMLTRHYEHELVMLGLQMGAVNYIRKDASAEAVLLETLRQMGFLAES